MPHQASLYERYRPLYPSALFAGLRKTLRPETGESPSVVDLGAGAGQSAASLLASGISARLTLVDPDPAMLELARAKPALSQTVCVAAAAEATGLPGAAYDLILIGSALHWMDAQRVAAECARIARPSGSLFVFEYQFPKALAPALAPLNEWIRREFNLRWKALAQRPRGSLKEILAPFDASLGWTPPTFERTPMSYELTPESFAGLLFSQSRYLDFESRLSDEAAREEERALTAAAIRARWPDAGGETFDFNLQSACLRCR